MPLTVMMTPGTAYRLYNDGDLLELLRAQDLRNAGWSAMLCPVGLLGLTSDDPAALGVRFVMGEKRIDSVCANAVIVTDGTTIQPLTYEQYTAAYPNAPLPE